MRKLLSLCVKIAVSGLLLYLALRLVNVGSVIDRLSQIDPPWLALGLLVMFCQIFLQSIRWRTIIEQCGAHLPLRRLFRLCMIALFFNQTLPSSVGGDAMRIWAIVKQTNWRVASYSVLLDRIVGVVALASLVVICLPWTLALVRDPIGRSALLAIGLGSIAAWFIFVTLGWERFAFLRRWSPTRHLVNVATVGLALFRSPSSFATVFGLSILIQLLAAVAAWCAARSINADLSLLYSVYLVPPVMLVAVIPISIAGWGVREGAMVAAFAYAGLPQDDGLVVSLLFGANALLLGAIGGVVWILSAERSQSEHTLAATRD